MSVSLPPRRLTWVAAAMCVAMLVSQAAAEDASDAPWARGVTDAQQAQALRHFQAGLELHRQLLFAEAGSSYEQALAHWPHPKFFLYLSHARAKQGAHLEAHEALEQALRGDSRAMSASERRLARDLQTELARELAAVTVRCDEPGAEITINGQAWFTGPGTRRRTVQPGAYVVEATRPGHVSVTRSITLRRGEWSLIEPRLVRDQDAILVAHRWSRATPWLVTGAGLVASAAGAWLYMESARHFAEVQEQAGEGCMPEDPSCDSVPARALYERAQVERSIGVGALAAGSSALAAALVMHYLNRSHRSPNEEAGSSEMELRPLVDGHTTGVSLRIEF